MELPITNLTIQERRLKVCISFVLLWLVHICTIYVQNSKGLTFHGSQFLKDFCGLIYADHQVEYIGSLSHCFFSRIKISQSVSLQQNLCNVPQNFYVYSMYAYQYWSIYSSSFFFLFLSDWCTQWMVLCSFSPPLVFAKGISPGWASCEQYQSSDIGVAWVTS